MQEGFCVGDRVRLKSEGCLGTVTLYGWSGIDVQFDGKPTAEFFSWEQLPLLEAAAF